MMGNLINAHQHQFVTKHILASKPEALFCSGSDLLSLGDSLFGGFGWGLSYITDRLNKIFPCHYVQNLLEVDLLDTNQSDRSLIGAVCCCAQCARA